MAQQKMTYSEAARKDERLINMEIMIELRELRELKKNMAQLENEVSHDITILNTSQVVAYWQPTQVLRFKKIINDEPFAITYNTILQQMWQSNTGEQEWRDIPEEN